jgi:capsid protein
VEHNRQDQIVRYWLSKWENEGYNAGYTHNGLHSLTTAGAWQYDEMTQRVEKAFLHLFNGKRFSQSRGVPAMHAVLNTAGMHADLQFANLVRSQMASYVGFIHEIPVSAEDYEAPESEIEYDYETGEYRRKGVDLSPGSSYYPDYPGEKITPFSANLPNPEFFPHAKMLLTFIATSLDMPLILFLLDASETNFSSWRGAVDQFKIAAERFQQWHTSSFHKPVLRFKQRQWMREDSAMRRAFNSLGEDYFHHQWRFPKWHHVQPVEDVKAEVMELGNLLDSPRAVAARHNRDLDKIITETCEDRANAILCGIEKAQELNKHPYIKENPHETVTWREVMPLPLSDNAQMQLLTGDPKADEKAAEAKAASSPGLEAKGTSK